MRKLFNLVLVFFAITSPLLAQKPAALEKDASKEVMSVVQRLFDAMRMGEVATVRAVFIPEGQLVSTTLRDGQPTTRVLTLDAFAKLVNDAKDPFIERMFKPKVRVYGDLATVEGRYDFHVGQRLTNCGINAFQLARTPDGWKIAHVASTILTKGCEGQSKQQEAK
ncbi:MAG: nuclear transport factor 2 family protein [Pyrinomonadaceae bacterium]